MVESDTPISEKAPEKQPENEALLAAQKPDEKPTLERPKHWRWKWCIQIIFKPRHTFRQIASQTFSLWQVPILVILCTALLEVVASGYVRQKAAEMGEFTPPPGFEYYSPEQQEQFRQAMSATSSPAFLYVLPAFLSALRVIAGWLLVGGILHLVMTLLGGRGDTSSMMNIVAWAALPLAIRSLIRAVSIYLNGKLINSSGLSGFVEATGSNWNLLFSIVLALIDIYMIWYAILLMLGVRQSTHLSIPKVIFGVLFTLLLVLFTQALVSFGIAKIGNLTIIRPFF